MISFEGQKSPKLIREIQEHEEAPKVLSSLFTPEELSGIREIQRLAFLDSEHCSEKLVNEGHEPLGKMAHPTGDLHRKLESLFREKLAPCLHYPYKISFTFHRNFFPYGIHTDSSYDSSEFLYKQGIVPLEVFPEGGEVYTVIFRQKSYHSISYPRDVETIQALTEKERQVIWELNQSEEISEKDLEKFWDGAGSRDRLRGFQISLAFRWKLGDMALWDRAHLHCSSDFAGHGIDGKIGLMFVTHRI